MIEKTIVLRGHDKGHHDEGVLGAGVCTPGMAIELQAAGTFLQQSSAIATALKKAVKIVKEDALQGRTLLDAYASGERVFYYIPLPGDIINLFVKSGQNIVVGDNLVVEGTGSGLFIEAAGTEVKFQFEALESSGGALGANTHLKARYNG